MADLFSADEFWKDTSDGTDLGPKETTYNLIQNSRQRFSQELFLEEDYSDTLEGISSFNAGTSRVAPTKSFRKKPKKNSKLIFKTPSQFPTTAYERPHDNLVDLDNSNAESASVFWSYENCENFKDILRQGIDIVAALIIDDGEGGVGVTLEEVTILLSSNPDSDIGDGKDLLVYMKGAIESYSEVSAESTTSKGKENPLQELPVPFRVIKSDDILFILNGKQTPVFEPFLNWHEPMNDDDEPQQEMMPSAFCCSLVAVDYTLDLIASAEPERDAISFGFAAFLGFRIPAKPSESHVLSRMVGKFSHTTRLVSKVITQQKATLGLDIGTIDDEIGSDSSSSTSSVSSSVSSSFSSSSSSTNYLQTAKGELTNLKEGNPSDAIGVLQQQLKAATTQTMGHKDERGRQVPASVEFIRPGGFTDSAFGDATCRRCNGDTALGSGLFMRCEACFDWYHPECVSALRRMQIETLLALQRWICRACFVKNKKYKNAKQMLLKGKKQTRDSFSDKDSQRRDHENGNDVDSESSGDQGDNSEVEVTRTNRKKRSPKPRETGPTLASDLNKLLASVDGEGTPRFLRWAHKCEDHACQSGYNDLLVSEALAQYCMECSPTRAPGSHHNTSDMRSVFLDVISALYQRPLFTCRLLFTHGLKKLLLNPASNMIEKYLPVSVKLKLGALVWYLQNVASSTSTKRSRKSRHLKNKASANRSYRRQNKKPNEQPKVDSSWMVPQPINWVIDATQSILNNGIPFLKTEDEFSGSNEDHVQPNPASTPDTIQSTQNRQKVQASESEGRKHPRRQKSSRASFSTSSTIISGGAGTW